MPELDPYKIGCQNTPYKLGLRSRLRIEVRPTENDLTRLYKNDDISVITCS